MPTLEQLALDYLHQTLGAAAKAVPWDGAARLPAFLTARYRFARLGLMGRELLLMLDVAPDAESPATIRTHMEQVRAKSPAPTVYVRGEVTAPNRKRLIEQRVPFIIPGNQMFLPELGLDLREYFRTPPRPPRAFRPATQAVLIFVLLQPEAEPEAGQPAPTASTLAPELGYTAMTLSRAFDELESAGLVACENVGRERILRLRRPRREIWEQARPWLIDPVKSRHLLAARPDAPRAGLDALARSTMLAEPRLPIVAIGQKQWRSFRESHEDADLDRESAGCEVEVWKYEPRAFGEQGVVDPLSLFLSVKPAGDERVEDALDQLMGDVRW